MTTKKQPRPEAGRAGRHASEIARILTVAGRRSIEMAVTASTSVLVLLGLFVARHFT